MIQTAVVFLIFAVAAAYLVRLVIKSFSSKTGCESGCGKCGAVDFNKIEKELKRKGI
jgi:bacterioferritin-associated ferredoxin